MPIHSPIERPQPPDPPETNADEVDRLLRERAYPRLESLLDLAHESLAEWIVETAQHPEHEHNEAALALIFEFASQGLDIEAEENRRW